MLSFSWFSFSCGFVLKFFFHGVFVVRPYGYALLVTERVWNREPRSHDRFKNKMAVYLKIRQSCILPFLISLYKIIASEKTLSFDEEGFQ